MGPVRSISQSPFLISTILDPFRLRFGCPQDKQLGAFGACGEHFRKIDPGIWNLTWNYEKMKVVSRNSVQNPGIEIFRSLLCQKTSISVYGNLRVFLMSCPLETPPAEEFWELVWVPLHAWAEIRSSPKIPLSTYIL